MADTTSFLPCAQAGVGVGLGVGGRGGQRLRFAGREGKGGYRGHFGSRYMLRLGKNVTKNLSLP